MALDMYLYRVVPPDDIELGAWIGWDEWLKRSKETQFRKADRQHVCKTVQRNAVSCFVEFRRHLMHFALHDMFRVLKCSDETAWDYARSFREREASARTGEFAFRMITENAEAQALLKASGANADLPAEKRRKITLEHTMEYGLECELAAPDAVRVRYLDPVKGKDYAGKYIHREWYENFAYRLEELAFQQDGISEEGRKLLDGPDFLIWDEKDRVQELVTQGGLSAEFIEKWIDGCTIFDASW